MLIINVYYYSCLLPCLRAYNSLFLIIAYKFDSVFCPLRAFTGLYVYAMNIPELRVFIHVMLTVNPSPTIHLERQKSKYAAREYTVFNELMFCTFSAKQMESIAMLTKMTDYLLK